MEIVTLAGRPDQLDAMWEMQSPWPRFMHNDPVGGAYCPAGPAGTSREDSTMQLPGAPDVIAEAPSQKLGTT